MTTIFIAIFLASVASVLLIKAASESNHSWTAGPVAVVCIFASLFYVVYLMVWLGDIPDKVSQAEYQRIEDKWKHCRTDPVCKGFVENYK